MDETSDSSQRSSSSSSTALYFSDRPGGLQGRGFSLSDGLYAFEHAVVTAMPDTPSPQVAGGGRRRRRRRGALISHAEEEGAPEAGSAVQPSPPVAARRSKRRRVSGRREEGNGSGPSPAGDDGFLDVWLEPRQPSSSSSSSSSCSSSSLSSLFSASEREAATTSDEPAGRRSESDGGSLSFLTAEERAWLGAETAAAEGSAPPPLREAAGGVGEDEEAGVCGAQVEGDAFLARQLQEQFDREHRLALPFGGQRQRCHHNRRANRQNHAEPLAREQRQEAQSPRTQHHQNNHLGTLSSHNTERIDDHTLDLLPDSDCPWLATVQWTAFSSLMNNNGGNDLTIGQPRGRGRGGFRRRGRDARLLDALGGNEYEALLDFEERQGTVVTKKKLNKREISAFPTKTYDPAQSAGNARCQICFCDYARGEELRMLTCFHDYHVKCIDRWLKVNATCPVCRCNMAESQSLERSSMTPI